jgi:hypothetical protein
MRESRELMIPPEWRGQPEGEISLMDTAKDVMEALIEQEMDMDAAVKWLCMRDGVEPEKMDEYAQRAFEYYAHNFEQETLEWLINNIDLKEEAIADERLPRGLVVTHSDGKGNLERRVGTGPAADEDEDAEDQWGKRMMIERKKCCRGCWGPYWINAEDRAVCACEEEPPQ